MAKVLVHVTVRDPRGDIKSFAPGDAAPDWLASVVTNPAVIETPKKPARRSKKDDSEKTED